MEAIVAPGGTAGLEVREGTFATRDGLDLYYVSRRAPGVAMTRLVVTVHGFADHAGRMPFLIEHLCARGAVVYSFDQRGNGRSPGQRGHVNAYGELTADLDSFLSLATEAEPGLERVLMGHSTGGILALAFAEDHPERMDRLVLSAPALILAFQAPAWKDLMARALASVLPKLSLQAGFDPGRVSRDEQVVAQNKADPLVVQDMSTRFYREVYLTAAPRALARVNELRVPFLAIQGMADRLVAPAVADELAARATVAHRVLRYPDAYHETYNDLDRDQVFRDLDAWLDGPLR
ncbi:MAG: lysophospholipase [Candidatus Dormibacteraeota bacterium]|nr:lysophospholipase [Candidatus Dormibacteraeota bacterium]